MLAKRTSKTIFWTILCSAIPVILVALATEFQSFSKYFLLVLLTGLLIFCIVQIVHRNKGNLLEVLKKILLWSIVYIPCLILVFWLTNMDEGIMPTVYKSLYVGPIIALIEEWDEAIRKQKD